MTYLYAFLLHQIDLKIGQKKYKKGTTRFALRYLQRNTR